MFVDSSPRFQIFDSLKFFHPSIFPIFIWKKITVSLKKPFVFEKLEKTDSMIRQFSKTIRKQASQRNFDLWSHREICALRDSITFRLNHYYLSYFWNIFLMDIHFSSIVTKLNAFVQFLLFHIYLTRLEL